VREKEEILPNVSNSSVDNLLTEYMKYVLGGGEGGKGTSILNIGLLVAKFKM
jgi:hypothetical protein